MQISLKIKYWQWPHQIIQKELGRKQIMLFHLGFGKTVEEGWEIGAGS